MTSIAKHYEAERNNAIKTARTQHCGRYFRTAWWRDANAFQAIATQERFLNAQAKN
jgi:hypothetical protein